MPNATLPHDDWLLTEALRRFEEREGRVPDDQAANRLAQRAGDDTAARLARRARALPVASGAAADLGRLAVLRRRLILLALLLAALAGFVAARAGLVNRELDVLLTLLTLLALPLLTLLLWTALLIWSFRRRHGTGASLFGRLLARTGRLLDSHLGSDLLGAQLRLLAQPYGRWYVSSLSHAFWLVYCLAALATLVVFFSLVQYQPVWGTTLLTEREIAGLIQALAQAPAAIGLFPFPSSEWIAAGRQGLTDGTDRAEWARLLMGLVLFYGAGPRIILLAVSLWLAKQGGQRLRLDLQQPGYLRLLPLLQPPPPPGQRLGDAPEAYRPRALRTTRHSDGPAILISLELDPNRRPDPHTWPGLDVLDLGPADRREQRGPLLDALRALPAPPPVLLAACSLLRTPDSGTAALIDELADAANSRLIVLLLDGEALRQRQPKPEQRLADWTALAERCGGLAVELDSADGRAIRQRLEGWPE